MHLLAAQHALAVGEGAGSHLRLQSRMVLLCHACLQAGHAPAPPATMALMRGLLAMLRPPSPARPPLHWRRSLLATAQLLLLLPPPDAEVCSWLRTACECTCSNMCVRRPWLTLLRTHICTVTPNCWQILLTPGACSR